MTCTVFLHLDFTVQLLFRELNKLIVGLCVCVRERDFMPCCLDAKRYCKGLKVCTRPSVAIVSCLLWKLSVEPVSPRQPPVCSAIVTVFHKSLNTFICGILMLDHFLTWLRAAAVDYILIDGQKLQNCSSFILKLWVLKAAETVSSVSSLLHCAIDFLTLQFWTQASSVLMLLECI